MLPISWFLALGIILFVVGAVLVLTRKNTIMILLGIELILNAANLNFVAFSKQNTMEGSLCALFVMALAAAEAAVALAIILNFYRIFRNIEVDEARNLRG